jgi:hypothetical protein
MRIRQVKLGTAVTIANQTEAFFDHKQNRCSMEWNAGVLTISAVGRSEDSKIFTIMVLSNNIAYMVPFEDGEEMFEIPNFNKKPEAKKK